MLSFVTGSRAYGKPTDTSDIDLVVLVDEEDLARLAAMSDTNKNPNPYLFNPDYGPEVKVKGNFRFGKLNLVALTDKMDFEVWKIITDDLKSRAPVSREYAKEVFKACFETEKADLKQQLFGE